MEEKISLAQLVKTLIQVFRAIRQELESIRNALWAIQDEISRQPYQPSLIEVLQSISKSLEKIAKQHEINEPRNVFTSLCEY